MAALFCRAEYTDTFNGEANYSWALRVGFTAKPEETNATIIRRAKRLLGITGRHRVEYSNEDAITIRPCNSNTILFIEFCWE